MNITAASPLPPSVTFSKQHANNVIGSDHQLSRSQPHVTYKNSTYTHTHKHTNAELWAPCQ